jgi:hypothetical protein
MSSFEGISAGCRAGTVAESSMLSAVIVDAARR